MPDDQRHAAARLVQLAALANRPLPGATSPKPAQLKARALPPGGEIQLAPEPGLHLPPAAWHGAQPAQARVRPTRDVPAGAPVQRKISYNIGKAYPDRDSLVQALQAIFSKSAHLRIEYWIAQYEAVGGFPYSAVAVYGMVVEHLKTEGLTPTFAVTSSATGSTHGPQMPVRDSRRSAENPAAATSSFNFSNVTLGRVTMWYGRNQVDFHDRQIDSDFHAEDGLIEQMEAFLQEHSIATRTIKLNLTINNFFCSEESTAKSKASDNCLDEMIALQRKHRFESFHVYFKNTYGTRQQMEAGIRRLQAAKIKVSSFTNESKKAPFVHSLLDPHSDDEDDGPSSRRRTRSPGRRGRDDRGPSPSPDRHEKDRERDRSRSPKRRGPEDSVTIRGSTYASTHPQVRDGGECFWDTMRCYGVREADLADAARRADLQVDKHVNEDRIWPFLQALTAVTGRPFRLNIERINILTMEPMGRVRRGDAGLLVRIGFFLNPEDSQGHYVPPRG